MTANAVSIVVDLLAGYGFVNTGGPHTPFAFNLSGIGALTAEWSTPSGGNFTAPGRGPASLSLNLTGGGNTPYGTYGVAIDSSGGNGSSRGYFGDLLFTLTRTGGLDTGDFVQNTVGGQPGYFFSADLSNGSSTGAQAWAARSVVPTTIPVPEPASLALLGAGILGLGAALRRGKAMA